MHELQPHSPRALPTCLTVASSLATQAVEGKAGLLRVEWTTEAGGEGMVSLATRMVPRPSGPIGAVTCRAPWWGGPADGGATGTKHGAWAPYTEAMLAARAAGAYCALLVDADGVVVDGDRVTPVIWDADGRVRYPPPADGAVESVTVRMVLDELRETDGEGGVPRTAEAEAFTLEELLAARQVVLLGSGVGVGRLASVDGVALSGSAGGEADTAEGPSFFEVMSGCLARARGKGWVDLREWATQKVTADELRAEQEQPRH